MARTRRIKESPTDRLMTMLAARHSGNAWVFMSQVPDGTGMAKQRTADALAMSLWPSRGIHLHGFEVKVSRGDWLRELKTPEKAESIAQHCHYWWIVVPDDTIVKDGELPTPWGLLMPRGTAIATKKQAVLREPVAPTWEFIAGVFRAASRDMVPTSSIAAIREEAYNSGVENGKRQVPRDAESHARLRTQVDEFEKASGIRIGEWAHGKEMGEAVKVLMRGGAHQLRRAAASVRGDAQRLLAVCDEIEKGLANETNS